MEEARFLIIRKSACDHWVSYEKYRLAYSANHDRTRFRANLLSWCTIVLGASTTASAALSAPILLTTAIGVLTTIAAGLQQTFKWEEKSLQFWTASSAMEQSCRAIKQYISGVALSN